MEYICNFLNHNGSYIGPSVIIEKSNLEAAIEVAFERLASHPDYNGFDILQDGERRHRFSRNLVATRF